MGVLAEKKQLIILQNTTPSPTNASASSSVDCTQFNVAGKMEDGFGSAVYNNYESDCKGNWTETSTEVSCTGDGNINCDSASIKLFSYYCEEDVGGTWTCSSDSYKCSC